SKAGSTVTLSDGGGSFIDDDTDADASVINEIQAVSRAGTDLTLSLGGGTVSIADNDNDTSNEIQSLSVIGTNLSISGGNTVSLADNDNSTANEVQTVSRAGTDITLSLGGGTVSVADNDNDTSNEIQTISKVGSTVTLSGGGGSFTDDDTDADASTINEIQIVSRAGTDLTLSLGGGTISIADNDNSTINELQDLTIDDSANLNIGGGTGVNLGARITPISGSGTGTIWTHPLYAVSVQYDSVEQIVTVANDTAYYFDVCIVGYGTTAGATPYSMCNDVGSTLTLSMDLDGYFGVTSDFGFHIITNRESTSATQGFVMDVTLWSSTWNGLVTYY
ncbi:MAG: hypothetical protein HN348_27760, partial [Proteobacteria bacterium]|nr:hypothetical protein [Pseudomonadota bacterium]